MDYDGATINDSDINIREGVRIVFDNKMTNPKNFKENIPVIVIGCIATAIFACSFPITSVLMSNMLTVLSQSERPNFWSRAGLFCGLFLVVAFASFVCMAIQTSCFNLAGERIG
ncbi:MAG: hypothetical protein EOP53_17800, partial [Sphingobacteriales bacterium]